MKFALLDGVNIATKVHQLVFGVGVSVLDLVNMALECLSRFVFVKVNFERSQAINRHIWLSSEAYRADFLSHLFLSYFGILCFYWFQGRLSNARVFRLNMFRVIENYFLIDNCRVGRGNGVLPWTSICRHQLFNHWYVCRPLLDIKLNWIVKRVHWYFRRTLRDLAHGSWLSWGEHAA